MKIIRLAVWLVAVLAAWPAAAENTDAIVGKVVRIYVREANNFFIETNLVRNAGGREHWTEVRFAAPLADDIITHVVPMLCPYAVAQAYKYRAKLTPGPLKKGKASASAASIFAAACAKHGGSPREAELIKGLTEPELINAVVAGCKVAVAAGSAGWAPSPAAAKPRATPAATARIS